MKPLKPKPIAEAPRQEAAAEEREVRIDTVHFSTDAIIEFIPINKVSSAHYEISLTSTLVSIRDKKTKRSYGVPLTNVKTIVFSD